MTYTAQFYPSGTVNVKSPHDRGAFYNLGYMSGLPECDGDRVRLGIADSMCEWLNDGDRPAWMEDMVRTGPVRAESADGFFIVVCGPFFDASPPKLNWRTCEEPASIDLRERMMDRLFGVGDEAGVKG